MWLWNGAMIDHLLIHYDVAYGLWGLVFITFGIFNFCLGAGIRSGHSSAN